jgi:OOP family OmpA-OmpF porin
VPFSFDRADLEPGAEAVLAAIVKELREHPNMTIDLEGTTDGVGRLDYNLRLSQRRVEAVTRWLTSKGVDRSRIIGAKGRGPHATAFLKDDVKRRVMVKLMTSAE